MSAGFKFSSDCGLDCQNKMVMAFLNGMKHDMIPIDQAGRIVLPKNIREELAISPGDLLQISVQGMAVTLTPHK